MTWWTGESKCIRKDRPRPKLDTEPTHSGQRTAAATTRRPPAAPAGGGGPAATCAVGPIARGFNGKFLTVGVVMGAGANLDVPGFVFDCREPSGKGLR